MNIRDLLNLYLVMGSQNCNDQPERVLREAIQGGVTCFQYREKGSGSRVGEDKFELGLRLKNLCHDYEIPFIVNDDVDLAMEIDADGVHIGQEDGLVQDIRSIIGDNKLLGVSAHNVKEAEQAISEGADYLGVGPMFPTTTKKDTEKVRGPVVIREIREHYSDFPLVGIGGISKRNVREVQSVGADGAAVISAISKAKDPYREAIDLKKEWVRGDLIKRQKVGWASKI